MESKTNPQNEVGLTYLILPELVREQLNQEEAKKSPRLPTPTTFVTILTSLVVALHNASLIKYLRLPVPCLDDIMRVTLSEMGCEAEYVYATVLRYLNQCRSMAVREAYTQLYDSFSTLMLSCMDPDTSHFEIQHALIEYRAKCRGLNNALCENGAFLFEGLDWNKVCYGYGHAWHMRIESPRVEE